MEKSRRIPSVLLMAIVPVLLATFIAYLIRGTNGVHIPLLAAVAGGIVLGVMEPNKGWIPALVQTAVLLVGVLVVGRESTVPEIEVHSLIGAISLTFIGSFIGAFIKRAFNG